MKETPEAHAARCIAPYHIVSDGLYLSLNVYLGKHLGPQVVEQWTSYARLEQEYSIFVLLDQVLCLSFEKKVMAITIRVEAKLFG